MVHQFRQAFHGQPRACPHERKFKKADHERRQSPVSLSVFCCIHYEALVGHCIEERIELFRFQGKVFGEVFRCCGMKGKVRTNLCLFLGIEDLEDF